MILYLLVALNGLTYSLIVFLIAFFSYINEGVLSIVPAIEIMIYLLILVILTAFCFRQLAFLTQSFFLPRIYNNRIRKLLHHYQSFIDSLKDRMDQFQREQESNLESEA